MSGERFALGCVLATTLAGLAPAAAAFADAFDTTADAVLGQSDFGGSFPNAPSGFPAADNLSLVNAAHCAVAPNGRLYVSDPGNNRILSWPDAAAFPTGAPADMVIGQPDFFSSAPNAGGATNAAGFSLPQGICVDAAGNLWVADAFNSRVLMFARPDQNDAVADLVIGQPDFTTGIDNHGNGAHGTDVALADSLQYPGRVLVHGLDVYVADSGNSRVLHYTQPLGILPAADRVFGQYNDFTRRAKNNDGLGNNGPSASSANLFNPIGLALDRENRLYIADWPNNRILRFDHPLTGDTTASAVFGQPDFVSRSPNNGGATVGLQLPIDLAWHPTNNLLVVDSGNNRVLACNAAGAPVRVFGQLDNFTSINPNHGALPDADGLFGPTGVAVDLRGDVFIADANNARLLRYDAPWRLPGDANCDGLTNLFDIDPFVLALTNPGQYEIDFPNCTGADADGDGAINNFDIDAFVAILLG